MSEQPVDRGAQPALPPHPSSSPKMLGLIGSASSALAVCGGLLALAVAVLATASVLGRWLFNAPIDGDFEFVKMATAVTVFMYLPYAQWRRGNIMVDTFTGWMSPAARRALDAFWDLVYAAFAAFMAYALFFGTSDAIRSGETTMQRQIPLWPSIGLSDLLAALLCIVTLATAWQLLRAGSADRS